MGDGQPNTILDETVLEGTPVLDKTFVLESLFEVLEEIPEELEGVFVLESLSEVLKEIPEELERVLVPLEGISVTVLDGRPVVLEGTALGVDESVPLVPVNVAERQSADADKKRRTAHEMKSK